MPNQSQPEQKKRGADEATCLTADKSNIDHRLDNARHEQVEPSECQQYDKRSNHLPDIRFEKEGDAKQVFHRGNLGYHTLAQKRAGQLASPQSNE